MKFKGYKITFNILNAICCFINNLPSVNVNA